MTNLQLCFKHASEQILVNVWCLKYQKLFKTMMRSRFQDMYLRAHKTALLNFISTHCEGVGITGSLQGKPALSMEKGCKNHKEPLSIYVVDKPCNIYRLRGNP